MNPLKRKRQEELKLTQQEMANKLQVHYKTINQYERNLRIPPLDRVLEIAGAYEMDNNELLEYIKYITEIKNNERVDGSENR